MKKRVILYWIPVVMCMAVIFLFSAQNADVSSQTSSLPAEMLAEFSAPLFGDSPLELVMDKCQFAVRKLAHFSVYAVLGAFTYNAFRITFENYSRLNCVFSLLLCLLYAAGDEIHQRFVPGRSCELRDVFIDFSGAVCGIVLLAVILSVFRKKKT